MRTLNVIGCGHVGRTLGRLWAQQSVFVIGDVLNRSYQSSARAVQFLGCGRPMATVEAMRPADIFLIGTPDDHLQACGLDLANAGVLRPGDIVFHCSGAIASTGLDPVTRCGALAASVHPLKSFADPQRSIDTFPGTFCGVEGNPAALDVLCAAFKAIGAEIFSIDPKFKTTYHAASVVVCNYLTALLELGVQCYVKAGIPRATAFRIMEPMVRGTVDNIFRLDTTTALTGPIARGDHRTVAKQFEELQKWNAGHAELYKHLGRVALDLSRAQGAATPEAMSVLAQILDR